MTSHNNTNLIRLFTAFASILLSLQAVYFDDLINRDGIMYLQMVEAYLQGGLAAAQAIYDWPTFSILIAWGHQLSGLPIEKVGFLLNSLLFVVLTDALVLISNKLVNSSRQLTIAAILILCFMPINEYRDFILRDPGYWAFASLALYQFILLIEAPNYKSATLWQVFMVIAILFRIEGAIILLALPLFFLFHKEMSNKFKRLSQAYYLLLLGLIGVIAFALTQPHLVDAFAKITSIIEYLKFETYQATLSQYSDVLKQQVLNKYSEDYATFILLSGLVMMLAYKLVKTFSVSYWVVYVVARRFKTPHINPKLQQLLVYFVILNVLILVVFLFRQYFISGRYTLLTMIGLLLVFMPVLCHGIEQMYLAKNKLLLAIVALALFYSVADTSTMSSNKNYIKQVARWAAHHIPDHSLVITDDEFLLYYFDSEKTASTLCVQTIFKATPFVKEYHIKMPYEDGPCAKKTAQDYRFYDYMIVVEKKRNPELISYLKALDLEQIYHNESKRKDGASVYKIIKH